MPHRRETVMPIGSRLRPALATSLAGLVAAVTLTTANAAGTMGPITAGLPAGKPNAAPLIHKVDVIGPDERTPIPNEYLRTAESVGLLWQQGGGSVCTAFCVGDEIIATNAHCLVTSRGRTMRRLDRFQFLRVPPNRRMQRSQHLSGLQLASPDAPHLSFYAGFYRGATTERTMIHDWAFAKLRRPICRGRSLKLDQRSPGELVAASRAGRLMMIGYHGDRGLDARWLSPRCRVEMRAGKLFMTHTCDSFKGSSGSPILLVDRAGDISVVGINVGSVATRRYRVQTDRRTRRRIGQPRLLSTSVINVAVGTAAFRNGLEAFARSRLLRDKGQFIEFQERLADEGLYNGEIDGAYGPMTREATMQLERRLNQRPIGLPTADLLDAMRARSVRR